MTERFSITAGELERSAAVEPVAEGTLRVNVEGEPAPVEVNVLAAGETSVVTVDGRVLTLLRLAGGSFYDLRARRVVTLERARSSERVKRAPATAGSSAELRAPMPGRIVRVLAEEGAEVAAGAGVVVIEAMKMENELGAPRTGTVRRVLVRAGDAVERDALLLEIG